MRREGFTLLEVLAAVAILGIAYIALGSSGIQGLQHDQQAMLYDTLQPGDVFVQVHFLTIPDGTSPGAYRLSVGWYENMTKRRLPVYDGATLRGDRLMLQEITVKP